jgi:hypothetical protein
VSIREWKRPERLQLVGDYSNALQVKDLWEEEARRHNCECEAVTLPEFAANQGRGVLALLNPGIGQAALLKRALSTQASKVLYFPPSAELAAGRVIEYCQNYRVLDAISGDPALASEAFKRSLAGFRSRLRCLLSKDHKDRRDHYEPIFHSLDLTTRDFCFIATPFIEPHFSIFNEGVQAAMNGLGIKISNPAAEHRLGEDIIVKIQNMIRVSKIVVANISQIDGRYNPNVFYELGFSHALENKIIVPFRHPTDIGLPPLDIRHGDYFLYEDAIDLALQLYWKLKAKVTNGSPD